MGQPRVSNAQPVTTVNRMTDLIGLCIAIHTYVQEVGDDNPLVGKGRVLAIRYQDDLQACLEKHIYPLVEAREIPQVQAKYTASKRGSGFPRILAIGDFLSATMVVLSGRIETFNGIFQGRARPVAREICQAAQQEAAAAVLHNLASLPTLSGLGSFRKWIAAAAESLGAGINDFDDALADAKSAINIAGQIKEVEAKILSTDPMDPQAAVLHTEKKKLTGKVQRLSEQSKNPQAVIGAAIVEMAKPSHATEIGRRLELSPEQEQALVATGRNVIAAGAGSGKCVTGDTLVATPWGTFRIDECADKGQVYSVDAEGLKHSIEPAQWLDMGTSRVYEVQTRSGVKLRGTPEHPLLTWKGEGVWTRLDAMEPGQYLVLCPGYALDTGIETVDPEEAYLLGLFMGDGWCDREKGRLAWARGGEWLPPKFYELSQRFWNYTPKAHPKGGDSKSVSHEICSRAVHNRLKEQGMYFHSAHDKCVPAWLMAASDAERIRFLQGLFDTDGTASGDRSFEWSTASETMARQVQQMLLGLGVVGFLKPKKVEGYDHTYWRLFVSGDQLRVFADTVGFRYEFKKVEDLDRLIEKDSNSNIGYAHVGALLRTVRDSWKKAGRWNGRQQSLLMDDRWVQVKHYLQESRTPSASQLQRLVKGSDCPEASLLRNLSKMYLDEVVSVREVEGEHRVYDFTVPTTHSFIANGVVSHNTRILAGKVVYHMETEGLTSRQIMACSFTRKSSEELKKRIVAYGGNIDTKSFSADGFGTTHQVAGAVLRRYGRSSGRKDAIKNYEQTELIRLAILQVMMVPSTKRWTPPDPSESFFSAPPDPAEARIEELGRVLDALLDFYDWVENNKGPGQWISKGRQIINAWKQRPVDPEQMNQRQKDTINTLLGYEVDGMSTGRPGTRSALRRRNMDGYRVASTTVPSLPARVAKRDEDEWPSWRARVEQKFPHWATTPANQWFNKGASKSEFVEGEGDRERDIPIGQFALFISNKKGKLEAPGKVAHNSVESGAAMDQDNLDVFSAVYGAYEWLKANEQTLEGRGDFDDVLINASKVLIEDPAALSAVQSRFKLVLADESQDLNASQVLFLGLVAGYYDPTTLGPREDGGMTADTFCLIGDDKQCIHEDSLVDTPRGDVRAGDLRPGDEVLSYRNGEVVSQVVRHVVQTNWDYGFKVTTESGCTLTMSPNHRLWASFKLLEGVPSNCVVSIAHGIGGTRVYSPKGERPLVFENYRDSLPHMTRLTIESGRHQARALSIHGGILPEVTAETLHVGLLVPVLTGTEIRLDPIVSIEKVPGRFLDLDVDDASNFFAGGILTHNSIYAFRGADPDIFIEHSNLYSEKGGFDTKLLTMNYRSGSAIVEAANQLIKHNEKQIPMTCRANVDRKGAGTIKEVTVPHADDLGTYVADAISEATSGEDAELTPKDFGIAVRTNREAYVYGIELIKKGIPFKSKYNFLKGPAVKALLNLARLANMGKDALKALPAEVNGIVLEAHKAPDFQISPVTLKERLSTLAPGQNWLKFLVDGGWKQIYQSRKRNEENVLPYVEYLKEVMNVKEKESSSLLNFLANRPGLEGKSLIDGLVEQVKNSKSSMEEVSEIAGKEEMGDIDMAIREYASGPISILGTIANAYPDLSHFVGFVNDLEDANNRLSKDDEPGSDVDAVQIDTVHGWKGLECRHLFLPMWESDVLGYGGFPHPMVEDDDMPSERRLAYVALTRGEDSVTILRPRVLGVTNKGNVITSKRSRFSVEGCVPEADATKTASDVRPETYPASTLEDEWGDFIAPDDVF